MGILKGLLGGGGGGAMAGGGGEGGGQDPLTMLSFLLGPMGAFGRGGGGGGAASGGGMAPLQAPQAGRPMSGGPLQIQPWQGKPSPFISAGGGGMPGQAGDIQKLIQMMMAGQGGGGGS